MLVERLMISIALVSFPLAASAAPDTLDRRAGSIAGVSGATDRSAAWLRVAQYLPRGIVTDERIDLPLDPSRGEPPKPSRRSVAVKVATRDGDTASLVDLAPTVAPVEVVAPNAAPDLVWDAATRSVATGGETVAYGVDKADLPAIVDRVALVRRLAEMAAAAPQPVTVQPAGRVQRAGQHIDIEIDEFDARALVVFSVAGDGSIQFLYPMRLEPPANTSRGVAFSVEVAEPFGADQIVAVSSARALTDFVQSIRRLDGRRAAGAALGLLDTLAADDVRIGMVAVLTQR